MFKSLSILLCFLFSYSIASAADVGISSATAVQGAPFTVTISVSNAADLFSANFDLSYDPSLVSFVSASKGTFLEQGGATTYLLTSNNSTTGRLMVGYSRQAVGGVSSGASGNGTLMTVTFNALANGSVNLDFLNNALCSAASGVGCTVIATNWSGGTVTIGSGQLPMPDTTPPTVDTFTIPSTSSSLTVSITGFTATDNTAVTGYIVNESATAPTSGATGWSSTAPSAYTFATQGSKTLYAWAKDAAGNVSASASRSVTVALPVTVVTQTTNTSVNLNQEIAPANCQYSNKAAALVSKNGTSDLAVSVKLSSSNLFSYGFYLAYDPNVYQFISYEPTLAIGTPAETQLMTAEMNSTEGAAGIVFSGDNAQPGKRVVLVSHSRLGYGTSGVSINEVVGKINFKIKTNSASEFIFSGTSIFTRSGAHTVAIQENHCWPKQFTSSYDTAGNVSLQSAGASVAIQAVIGTIATTQVAVVPSHSNSGVVPTPPTIANSFSKTVTPIIIRNLKILKNGDKSPIAEGQEVNSPTVIFEAFLFDSDDSNVRLEVEMSKNNEPFLGVPTFVSDYVPSGSTIQLEKHGLTNGMYKIQARAKRDTAPSRHYATFSTTILSGDWLDFGSRNITDFTINTAVKASQMEQEFSQTRIIGVAPQNKVNTLYKKSDTSRQTAPKTLTQNLKRGSVSNEVRALQEMLSKDKKIYPEQSIVGIFGPATERAVIRFQKKYNITPSVGFVGVKTRTKLNEVYGR